MKDFQNNEVVDKMTKEELCGGMLTTTDPSTGETTSPGISLSRVWMSHLDYNWWKHGVDGSGKLIQPYPYTTLPLTTLPLYNWLKHGVDGSGKLTMPTLPLTLQSSLRPGGGLRRPPTIPPGL